MLKHDSTDFNLFPIYTSKGVIRIAMHMECSIGLLILLCLNSWKYCIFGKPVIILSSSPKQVNPRTQASTFGTAEGMDIGWQKGGWGVREGA